jgi:hypothetical protein
MYAEAFLGIMPLFNEDAAYFEKIKIINCNQAGSTYADPYTQVYAN